MEVYGLVGPAGSGKSHRASMVARKHDIDLIIDDGLLISVREGKILAGTSAKREATMIGAVRRALFQNEDHAADVKDALAAAQPQRLLILGTSTGMVERICGALGLPEPTRIIRIEEIAAPYEIRRARRIRRELGKHVIPAPTLEVKKTFSGYLIDPLRFFFRQKESVDGPEVVEKSVVKPTYSSLGKFFIADTVVMAIAQRAALETPSVVRVQTVVVETRTTGVELTLELTMRYGSPLTPDLLDMQRRIRDKVEHMTALNVLAVNLEVRRLVVE